MKMHQHINFASVKIHELKFELIPHPNYSSDLAPSDYALFPHLINCPGEQKFESNEEVINAVYILACLGRMLKK